MEHCLICPRFESLGVEEQQAFVQCRPGTSVLPSGTSLVEALAATACGELLRSEVKCLDSELQAADAVRFLHSPCVQCGAVVDDRGVLIGVVELEALERKGADPGLEVEDAMTTEVVTAPVHATVAQVSRLMVQHNVDRIPVVTHDGRLVGVICAMDVVRWLSERLVP